MKILVVDDERIVRKALADELAAQGYQVLQAQSGEDALRQLEKSDCDLVICDLVMEGMNGGEVLRALKTGGSGAEFILMTAHPTVQSALEIIKQGALDYVIKPFAMEDILQHVRSAGETIRLKRENRDLKRRLSEREFSPDLIGRSPPMQRLHAMLSTVVDTESVVLIEGETGTGKGLVARILHENSSRKSGSFVTVSCGALSRELLESELFGHEQGAFTGAVKKRLGRFELAGEGTLFLDEVDDIPLETQVKLLRVLESGEFERLGGERTLKCTARILAAAKADLAQLVEAGRFRKDLYYRLNTVQIRLPPLRERKEDISPLCDFFLKKYSPKKNLRLSSEIMEYLFRYDWDGNVRELEHVVERLVLLGRDGEVGPQALPGRILNWDSNAALMAWGRETLPEFLSRIEFQALSEAERRSGGNRSAMADLLGIPLPTLKSKLKRHHQIKE